MKLPLAILATTLLACHPAGAQSTAPAEAIFSQYQSRERSFDPGIADLYCDTARIRNVRIYPNGQQRAVEVPAARYQQMIRDAMPLAREKGDYSTYSAVAFTPEGAGVRVTASRYSVLRQYTSPISLLIGACQGGRWAILEELSQSRP
ncbi:hypothetical protein [Paracidovorax anthurii]|uniref:Lumazine-binding protein n=1 Tax=Paracidovorax anthurii TaxID=78229 RepID=A0A328ZEI6_9BURK|nr:hypothetical protein [Paracidovorax anthurii]RAR84690.1 hypothetical protein AX018_101042 [Paracidovorax anthurii]